MTIKDLIQNLYADHMRVKCCLIWNDIIDCLSLDSFMHDDVAGNIYTKTINLRIV